MLVNQKYDESELLELLRSGNELAFTEIYNRHWEKMVNYAVRLTRSEEEATDIVQEIFVSIWNRRAVLEIKGTLAAYLIKSTRNLSLRYVENNINKHNFLESFSAHMQDLLIGFDDKYSLKQFQEHIDTKVEKLPAKMRQIYILSRNEQLSHREIGQRLGIAETTVKKQINNALKILSLSINNEFSATATAFFLYFLK